MAFTAFEHSMTLPEAANLHGRVLLTAGSVMERGVGEVMIDDVHLVPGVHTAQMEVQPHTHARVGIVAGDFSIMNRRSFQLRTQRVDDQAHIQIHGPDIETFDDGVAGVPSDDKLDLRVWGAPESQAGDSFIVSPNGWRQMLGQSVYYAGSIALRATRPSEIKIGVPRHAQGAVIPKVPAGVRISSVDTERMERVRFDLSAKGLLVAARVEVECYRRGEYKLTRDTAVIGETGNSLRWRRICRIRGRVGQVDGYRGSEARFNLGEIGLAASRVARFARGEIHAEDVLKTGN